MKTHRSPVQMAQINSERRERKSTTPATSEAATLQSDRSHRSDRSSTLNPKLERSLSPGGVLGGWAFSYGRGTPAGAKP